MTENAELLSHPVTVDLHVETIEYPKEPVVRGFAVFTGIDGKGRRIRCSGFFPGISAGRPVRVNGTWQLCSSRDGLRIRADGFDFLEFTGISEIRSYLTGLRARGCGPKTVDKIIAVYGVDTVREIRDAPDRFVKSRIPGVSITAKNAIRSAVTERLYIHEGYAFLIRNGFPEKSAVSIADRFGRETQSVFETDPYRFTLECPDIPFELIDRILLRNRREDAVSAERVASALLRKLRADAASGHVFSREAEVKAYASRLLGLTRTANGNLRNVFQDAVGSLFIKRAAETDGRGRYYLMGLKDIEARTAEMLHGLHLNPAPNPYASPGRLFRKDSGLSFEQKKAVWNVFEHPLSVITGGPGTGKSHITRIIWEAAENAGLSCMAAAPTGKAAGRLDSAIFGAGGADEERRPKTLHRLLCASDSGERFRRNSRSRLPYDLLIIDEASMIDIELAHALLSAVPPKARVVFIGDADQLPPVGQGNFFADMIASGCIPVTRLTGVFRQDAGSSLVLNAERIRDGKFPFCAGKFGLADDDFFFFECTGDQTPGRLLDCVTRELPRQFGADPLKDIQVLTPVNPGPLGTVGLNRLLRGRLNPAAPDREDYAVGECTFRTGDKVMQAANDYTLMVFNGDTGYIREIARDRIRVFFPDSERTVDYGRRQARALRLAYAVTIHKAQGTETEICVVVMDARNSASAVRRQLYTAVTRARRAVVLIGERAAFRDALSDRNAVLRNTELADRIRERFIV